MNYCINNPNRSFIIGDSHYDCHPLYSKYGYVTANNDNKCPSNYKVLNGLGICIPTIDNNIIPPELINSYCISNSHLFNNSFLDMSNNQFSCFTLLSNISNIDFVSNNSSSCSTNNLLSMCISPNIYSPNFSQANILYPSVKYNNMCPYNWTRVNICNGEPVKRVKNYYDTIQPTQTISNQGIPNMCLCTIS